MPRAFTSRSRSSGLRAGWSKGFQREWKSYYGEDWVSPDSSPDAQYKASKLKYYLYQRALKQVFDFVKAYNAEHGTNVKCYVPTHSLVNYALWCIVSPESSLLNVGADGYIAQVMDGTARSPNMYEGKREERTFESAFLEYGAMMNIVRASGATVWFLNDPIEDNPRHMGRLPHELGEHAHGIPSLAAGLALRGHAVA